jgi:hypothetical protein
VQKLVKFIVTAELIALVAFNIAVRMSDAAEPGRTGSGNIGAFVRWSQTSGACFYLLVALSFRSSILIVARHGQASIGRALTLRSLDGVSVLLPMNPSVAREMAPGYSPHTKRATSASLRRVRIAYSVRSSRDAGAAARTIPAGLATGSRRMGSGR